MEQVLHEANAHAPQPLGCDGTEKDTAEVKSGQLRALRDKLFARNPDVAEHETFSTINVMENLVLRHVDEVMCRFKVCTCDRCRCDICALALNSLPPRYAVVQAGKISSVEAEISPQLIMDALIKAALCIRARPHH